MKKSILLLVTLLSIVCISTGLLNVSALQSNEWSPSLSWTESTYYQGDSGSVTVTFCSSCPEEIKIKSVGIHFDWQSPDKYFELDLSSSPVGITSNGQQTFRAITFNIPSTVTVGSHSVSVRVQGQQHGLWWYDFAETSNPQSIYVHDAYEKVYNQVYSNTLGKISNAQSANYRSPDAQSFLQQASTEFDLATSLAQQGKWQDAVSHLNAASTSIDQANAKEQTYQPPQTSDPSPLISESPNNTTLELALVVAAILVAIIILIIIVKKRNNNRQQNNQW